LIFRGILDELTTASPSARARLQQAMRDAVIRYLEPVFLQSKGDPQTRSFTAQKRQSGYALKPVASARALRLRVE
jgi:hypothetical protein